MSRRMNLPTKELGEIQVLTISERDGVWEEEWEPLRDRPIGGLLSVVTRETISNALYGLTRPLALALGLPPSGALVKLPNAARTCERKKPCPFYDPKLCFPTTKKTMPWCYEPAGISNEKEREAAAKAIGLWREGVYLVIVKEDYV